MAYIYIYIYIRIYMLISLPGCMADPHPSASFLRCRRDIYLSRSEENSPSVDRGTGLALVGAFVIGSGARSDTDRAPA